MFLEPPAKPTLVLHIGFPKTGSSALQNALALNHAALSARGLHYALRGIDPRRPADMIMSGNGGALALRLKPAVQIRTYGPTRFDLSDYLSDAHPLSLISSEALSEAGSPALIAFRDEVADQADLRIVMVLRDLVAHAHSSWLHAIKRDAYSGDLLTFCRERYADNPQYRSARRFRKVFGAQAVTAIHYESAQGDLLRALLTALGVSADGLSSPRRMNRGLGAGETAFMRVANAVHRSKDLSMAVSDLLLMRPSAGAPVAAPPPALVQLLTQRHAGELRWANDRFFGKRPTWRVAGEAPRSN